MLWLCMSWIKPSAARENTMMLCLGVDILDGSSKMGADSFKLFIGTSWIRPGTDTMVL